MQKLFRGCEEGKEVQVQNIIISTAIIILGCVFTSLLLGAILIFQYAEFYRQSKESCYICYLNQNMVLLMFISAAPYCLDAVIERNQNRKYPKNILGPFKPSVLCNC